MTAQDNLRPTLDIFKPKILPADSSFEIECIRPSGMPPPNILYVKKSTNTSHISIKSQNHFSVGMFEKNVEFQIGISNVNLVVHFL